jgi:YVTN family beta-propeller protein
MKMPFTNHILAGPVWVWLLLVILIGCDASDPDDTTSGIRVLVANQGNFADGNGSISGYNPDTGDVSVVVSQTGSIIQSIAVRDGLLYAAMNTGDRVDIIDATRGLVGQIVDVSSPRYMAWADADQLLVSNLFDNTVSMLSVTSGTTVASVGVGVNPEGITVHGGLAYAANHGFGEGATVSVIDIATAAVVQTLILACDGPRFVFFDREEEMWTVCTGKTMYDAEYNVVGTTNGAVLVVDPASGQTQTRFDLEDMVSTAGPGQDAFYSEGAEMLFVIANSDRILRFDTAQNRSLATIGPIAGAPLGAVAFDDVDQRLYVGRVPGFTQAGRVTVMQPDGTVAGEFSVGVAPSHIEILHDGGWGG